MKESKITTIIGFILAFIGVMVGFVFGSEHISRWCSCDN